MKGDFSRSTFDRTKHYSGVLLQQGRVLTDSDLNEEHCLQQNRIEIEAVDVIGRAGAPKQDGGFQITVTPDFHDLTISSGRFYAGGILCENEAAVSYTAQPDLPNPPSLTAALATSPVGLVYLEVFDRHKTALDDAELRDVALSGPDTTTRVQTVWQVKSVAVASLNLSAAQRAAIEANLHDQRTVLVQLQDPATDHTVLQQQLKTLREDNARRLENFGLACENNIPEWAATTAAPTGRLLVQTAPVTSGTEPCGVPPGAGYLRGENQFYRVEVHQTGTNADRSDTTFKWSRENGSVVAAIQAVGNTETGTATGVLLRVDSTGRDENLSFVREGWVEYTDDAIELSGQPGVLAQVKSFDSSARTMELHTAITVDFNRHPKLRRWEQVTTASSTGVGMNTADGQWLDLEANIQVQFTTGTFRRGDYWTFSARAASGKLDFPATAQPPDGIRRRFALLGAIYLMAGELYLLLDCRKLFPPLTAITASDVYFNNTICTIPNAKTVQDAIDQLCRRTGGGTCTLTASPGANWENVFNLVPDLGSAQICLTAGEFTLSSAVTIRNKRGLKVIGAGPATRIVARGVESALIFEDCAEIFLRDLSIESTQAVAGDGDTEGLNGTVMFRRCLSVDVEAVTLRCGHGATKAASCLYFISENLTGADPSDLATGRGLLRVRGCTILPGHSQIGVLVVNAARTHIEDNVVRISGAKPERIRVAAAATDVQLRAEVRRILVGAIEQGTNRGPNWFSTTVGNFPVSFVTHQELIRLEIWPEALRLFPPRNVDNFGEVQDYLKNVADALIERPAQTLPRFQQFYTGIVIPDDRPAFYQGIVVAGVEAEEVRILNNTIHSGAQGIHIGLSRRGDRSHLKAGALHITGNTIYTLRPPLVTRESEGIFVGNAQTTSIGENVLTHVPLNSTAHLDTTGIDVSGELGQRLLIRNNQATGYTTGIAVEPVNPPKPTLWVATENLASTNLPSLVIQANNVAP